MSKECVQNGHLIYEDEKKRQPDITFPCWSGENYYAHLLLRRKKWSVGGLTVIIILAVIQLAWLLSKKFPKLFEVKEV